MSDPKRQAISHYYLPIAARKPRMRLIVGQRGRAAAELLPDELRCELTKEGRTFGGLILLLY